MSTKGMARSEGTAPNELTGSANGLAPERAGFGRERVAEIQRARLLGAMTEVACERGASNVTVAHVVQYAGVSRRTYYELFADRESCFLAALDDAIVRTSDRVALACETRGRWREQIRASLAALLGFLDEEPRVGRLLIVESLGAGPRSLERRGRVLARVTAFVDGGRDEAKVGAGLPSLTAEGIVGAVLSLIHNRMIKGESGSLIELTNPLMSMIVLPYLGSAAARRELERSEPKVMTTRRPLAPCNPLKAVEMRLTYRTVRVLTAVGVNPGASNRLIAEVSEVADQGQISKLLARLERLGLIENTDPGSVPGGSNAWSLTKTGREVHGALTAQQH